MALKEKTLLTRLVVPIISIAIFASSPLTRANMAYGDEVLTTEQEAQPLTVEHTIKSQFPAQDRLVTVRLPESYYDNPDASFPVLYVLDGENNTAFTSSAAKFLADGGQIPELIVVGIHSGSTRQVDYVPQAKADQYLDFLEKELVGYIEDNYRVTSYRLLSGHSLGGLLTTYAMTERPGLFQAHFAQSPSIRGEEIPQSVEHLLTENPTLHGAYFITLGDEPSLEPGFEAMKAVLEETAPTSFQWAADRQLSRSHMQTRMIGIYTGLEQNFASDWPLPDRLLKDIDAAAIRAHMNAVSTKYGVDQENYSVDAMIGAVQSLFQNRDINGAVSMAEIFVAEYPENVIAHFFLANGYANSGKPSEALEQVNISIELLEADVVQAEESGPLLAAMRQMQTQLSSD